MPKTPPPDFKIHVDSSCLTDSTDLMMAPDRVTSSETVIHHDPTSEEPSVRDEVQTEENKQEDDEENLEDDAESDFSDPTTSELARERQIDRIEAQIQAAARAVVASIEQDNYHGEDSILSAQTDEGYDGNSQLTYGDGTELTYDGTEGTYETEDEHNEQEGEGDSSSHHDGDIDDDVFSHSDHSGRSSLNSIHDLQSADETQGKDLTSPVVGEEAATDPVSRIPSAASFTPRESTPLTPSRVLSRPPFRTPSSVRAIQMSSPTPSIFSSPRSIKRHLPTVSRIGTPNSHFSSPSKKTPTRFKAKKEYPLVLLHVTVLPLSWTYSHIISSPDLPPTLQSVKDNWRLLQDKVGDTVLERGILLPHPQDSYEVLEERLLEALELPVRPRAMILKCGHYMGPETPISSSEDETKELKEHYFHREQSKWCDICGKEVRTEGALDGTAEQRFRIKIYASNGLMRAGAWAAAWRDMERVDVEIEPWVEGGLAVELEHMALSASFLPHGETEVDDGFVDEEELHSSHNIATPKTEQMRRKMMEEERMREIYGPDTPSPMERPKRHSRSIEHGDSLPELLTAAFKVAMRDKKNVAICLLSVLVLLLALRPRSTPQAPSNAVMQTSEVAPHPAERALPVLSGVPSKIAEVVQPVEKALPVPRVEIVPQAVEVPAEAPPSRKPPVEVKNTSPEPSAIPPPLVVNLASDSEPTQQVVVNAHEYIHHTPEEKKKEEIPI